MEHENTNNQEAPNSDLGAVSGNYMVERMKKILEQPEPLKEPPYNCTSTGDKRFGNGCSYPNCMCEWYL